MRSIHRTFAMSFLALGVAMGASLSMPTGAGAVDAASTIGTAATIVVTNDSDCATPGCGSLRAAIDAANLESDDPTITFALPPASSILLTSDLPTITRSMSIIGPGPRDLTIHGAGQYRAFTASGNPLDSLSISGIALIHNASTTSGGSIQSSNFDLTLRDIHAEFNRAGGPSVSQVAGGAVFAAGGGAIRILDCLFNLNIAFPVPGDDSHGGSLYLSALDIAIERTTVQYSTASYDGGVDLDAETLSIVDSTFRNNEASIATGGGTFGAGTIDITGSRFSENVAPNGISGVLLNAYTRVAVIDSRFDHNGDLDETAASAFGTGYFASNDVRLDRVTIDHNRGTQVGGPVIMGAATISDSTISDNDGIGVLVGGLQPVELTPQTPLEPLVTISNTTVTDNSAYGISASTTSCVTSASFVPSSNSLSACSLEDRTLVEMTSIEASPLILDHVLAHGNGLLDVIAPGTATWSLIGTMSPDLTSGVGTFAADPLLAPLSCVDDLTCVRTFDTDSPVWNAGDPSFVGPPIIDQLGLPRIVDVVDIGAVENQTALQRPVFTG